MFPFEKLNRYPQEGQQKMTAIEVVAEGQPQGEESQKMSLAFFSIETVHGMEHICEVYETVTDSWIGAD